MPRDPWLTARARRRPDAVALEVDGAVVTWRELHRRAGGAAAELAARGVGPGDRVAVALPAGIDFAVTLHACLLMGAAAMPIDLRLPASDREALGATADVVVDAPLERRGAGDAAAPWREGDVALVVHTSGTTGRPKPVELTWGNVWASAAGTAIVLGLRRDDRWLCPLPLAHVGGLMVLMRSLVLGTAAVLVPPPFDPAAAGARLARGDVTLASIVPTMLVRMLDAGLAAPPAVRAVLLGGGPAGEALIERAQAAAVPVAQTYGMTETCSHATISEPGDARTAGWPLPNVDVRLAEDGEILVEGPIVAGGEVLRTGDLGRFDERGRLQVIGRNADTVVTGGENVAPAEVEAVLLAHPAVADAAVFARPDPEWGERLCARVVLRRGAATEPGELRRWCAERLAGFKVPKVVEMVSELPRTPSGKLLRRELR